MFEAPSFAEFCAPLTLAMSLSGIAVEEPFDVLRNSKDDFFSVVGKKRLVAMETSARTVAKHWGPHDNLDAYEAWYEGDQLCFSTAEEAEYP